MPQDLTDDQVIAWCHQATIHCLSQCWPRSLSPCGNTRPQWINGEQAEHHVIAHELLTETAGCKAIFHNYYYYKDVGVLQQRWPNINLGGMSKYHNASIGAWIEIYYVLCSETYSTFGIVLKSAAFSRQATGKARICETRLLNLHTGHLWNSNWECKYLIWQDIRTSG